MAFEEQPFEDMRAEDIEALVEQREPESQSLDFKREPWGTTSSDKRERLRDIVAMANGGGGYVLLGVEEDDGRASQIVRVNDASRQADSILNAVIDGIQPRISDIEAKVISTADGDIVLVRVPPGAPLYAVANGAEYWRRCCTIKTRLTAHDIEHAYHKHMGASGPAASAGAEDKGTRRDLAADRERTPSTLPLVSWTFRHIMDVRADAEISRRPYYRATLTPFDIDRSISFSHDLRSLLSSPPSTRRSGYHIWELTLSQPETGLLGVNHQRGHCVRLERNGFIEFRFPLTPDTYEIELLERRGPLKPYPLIELPVSFYRLALSVYKSLGMSGPAIAQHSYHNIRKFRLAPGVPSDDEWGAEYPTSDFLGRDVYVPDVSDFHPDGVVYELIEEFYAAFGFDPETIPLFDEEHNFKP